MQDTTYSTLASFAQTWGLLFFVLMFAIALIYALKPGNKKMFDRAAHMPLQDDEKEDF